MRPIVLNCPASRYGDLPPAAFLPLTDDQKVDARALHGWLGIGRDFSNWMRKLIDDYGFEAGEDYSPVLAKSSGGRPKKDYLLSLDVAKEIAMIGNTPKGKATRRYFIAAEKAAAATTSSAQSSWTASRGSTPRTPAAFSAYVWKAGQTATSAALRRMRSGLSRGLAPRVLVSSSAPPAWPLPLPKAASTNSSCAQTNRKRSSSRTG